MLNRIKSLLNQDAQKKSAPTEPSLALAIAALMIEIMHSDDKLEQVEQQVIIQALKARFDMTSADVEQLITDATTATSHATDFHQFTSLIKEHYSTDERINILKELWEIAMADGHIDTYEEHLIRRIANLIGIYHNEFIQAKMQARKHIPAK